MVWGRYLIVGYVVGSLGRGFRKRASLNNSPQLFKELSGTLECMPAAKISETPSLGKPDAR